MEHPDPYHEPSTPPVTPTPPVQQHGYTGGMAKPGEVTAIAVLCLVSGVLDCIGCLTVLALWPGGIYSLIVGIFEIVYATKLLADPVRTSRPSTAVAVMQIINIVNCSILAVVTGILSLAFYGNPKVRAYFDQMRAMGVPG